MTCTATAGTAKRTRMTPQARRAQLIELGVEMLSTRPLEDLSVELIATTAGISRGLLFHYFSSKHEFHLEVARAAGAQMVERTEPDPALPPVGALRGSIDAFVAYVEQNPDNYKSLVRGAASGDADMRAVFDDTRAAMAQRTIESASALGLEVSAPVELAIRGWIAFVEECVIRWVDDPAISRAELLEILTSSLPAIVLAAAGGAGGDLLAAGLENGGSTGTRAS